MSAATDLQEASDNIARIIKQITANPKPNYEIDGQRVDWADYLDMLLEGKSKVDALIAKGTPFAEEIQMFTPDNPRY